MQNVQEEGLAVRWSACPRQNLPDVLQPQRERLLELVPPRRSEDTDPREPSPSTPGDNKRQSRRLKAGQQALGAHFRSRPRTLQRLGHRHRGLARWRNLGGNSCPGIMSTPRHGDFGSAYHPADHSRPQYLRQGHVPPDGFQAASLKRRWRNALIGTVGPVGPTAVQSSSAGVVGLAWGAVPPGLSASRTGPARQRMAAARPCIICSGYRLRSLELSFSPLGCDPWLQRRSCQNLMREWWSALAH